jgi:WD40 repeat protein
MSQIRLIRVFLSSPGDVTEERQIAMEVIERLPNRPAFREKVAFRIIAWDKPGAGTPMRATLTPQEAINKGLPRPAECDIVVVIFWSRMGTPFSLDNHEYLSGTHWELLDALQTDQPQTIIYHRTEEMLFKAQDIQGQEQYKNVEAFFKSDLFYDPITNAIKRGVNNYKAPNDFRQQFETHIEELVVELLEKPAIESPSEPVPENTSNIKTITVSPWLSSPFPGLRAFTPADAPIYFGRGYETGVLIQRLAASKFVAVVGASGSGKSSLVGAGLIPRLKANTIPGSNDWVLPDWKSEVRQWVGLRFTPGEVGDNPFMALALKLAPFTGDAPRDLAEKLSKNPGTLAENIVQLLLNQPDWAEVLIFIDQFEELFTLVHPQYRIAFVELLEKAIMGERIRIVVTLRADFYDRCVEIPKLADILESTTFPLAAPTPFELDEMIVRPAEQAGLEFENGLSERILQDTGTEPGALALMAYALDELYHTGAEDKRLTQVEYEALGGVQGAIGERAETVFMTLDTEAQAALPTVFSEIVEVDERGEPTRRRARLMDVARNPAANRLVEALTGERARLLVQDRDVEGHPIVEVAHEALLRRWPRLSSWIEREQDTLRLRRQIQQAAQEWDEHGRDPAFLLSGGRLSRARTLLEQGDISDVQKEFVGASESAEEERKGREKRRERTLIQTRFGFIFALVVIGLLAFGFIAFQRQQDNLNAVQRDASIVLSRFLADQSQSQRSSGNIQPAILLALKSMDEDIESVQGEIALKDALAYVNPAEKSHLVLDANVKGMSLDDTGHRILTWADNGVVSIWNETTGTLISTVHHNLAVNGAIWSTDKSRILTWSIDGTARVWDVNTGNPVLIIRQSLPITGATWNKNETNILTWSIDDTARVWDKSGIPILTLRHEKAVNGAIWNTDEKQILTWSEDGTARVWNAESGEPLLIMRHDLGVINAAWNKAGTRIFTWLDANNADRNYSTVRMWDTQSGLEMSDLRLDGYAVNGAILNADKSQLLTWNNILQESLSPVPPDATVPSTPPTDSVGNSVDKLIFGTNHILTLQKSQPVQSIVRLWDTTTLTDRAIFQQTSPVIGAGWNSDETRILTWGYRQVHLWHNEDKEKVVDVNADYITRCQLDDSGNHLLILADGRVYAEDVSPQQGVLQLQHERSSVDQVIWDSSDAIAITASYEDNVVFVWDLTVPKPNIVRFDVPAEGPVKIIDTPVTVAPAPVEVQSVSVTRTIYQNRDSAIWSNNQQFLMTFNGLTLRVWDARSGMLVPKLSGNTDSPILSGAWNPNDTQILTWSDDNSIQIWDTTSDKRMRTLPVDSLVVGAAWNAKSTQILTWSDDNSVQIWDVTSGNNLQSLHPSFLVDGAAWNADSTRILTWSRDGIVQMWNAGSGFPIFEPVHSNGQFTRPDRQEQLQPAQGVVVSIEAKPRPDIRSNTFLGAIWNPTGTQFLTVGGGVVSVRDANQGLPLFTANYEGSPIKGAAWNPDGTRFLTWSDYQVQVWEIAGSKSIVAELTSATSPINAAIWNPQGTRILTWSVDGLLRVFSDKKHLVSLSTEGRVLDVAWSNDGQSILAYSSNPLSIQSLTPMEVTNLEALKKIAKSYTYRDFSPAEKKAFYLEEPSSAPVPTLTALPTLTPLSVESTSTLLPTLTPSPAPTLTPTLTVGQIQQQIASAGLPFEPLLPDGFQGYSGFSINDNPERYGDYRPLWSPGSIELIVEFTIGNEDTGSNIRLEESLSPYPTIQDWEDAPEVQTALINYRLSSLDRLTIAGKEIKVIVRDESSNIYILIENGVFIAVRSRNLADEATVRLFIEGLLPHTTNP